MRAAVMALCVFTILASGWLFVMFLVLRHPGFEWRAALSLGVAAISVVTLAGLWKPTCGIALHAAMAGGAAALGAAGVWAMKTNVDEGFVDLISLAFIAQAGLTLGYLLARRVRQVRGT
jgi:hypothetical protein